MKNILTPEQYIVKRIEFLERENINLIEEVQTTTLCNKAMQEKYNDLKQEYDKYYDRTCKYIFLLDKIKPLLHIEEGYTTKIKCIKYTYDTEANTSHCVAFEDEELYKLLIELLGPLKEEQ